MNSVVFRENDFQNLRVFFQREAPKESAAILLAGVSQSNLSTRFLVREIHFPPDHSLSDRTPLSVEIKPDYLAPLLKRARDEGWSMIFVHSHPFSGQPTFSNVDAEGENVLAPTLFSRAPNRPHAWIVLGTNGFEGRFRSDLKSTFKIDQIVECGTSFSAWTNGNSSGNLDKHDRTVRAIGEDGQKILQQLRVGIVGLGGMGSIVAEQLAHLGVNDFSLLDYDSLEASNLNRVVGSNPSDIGKPKVEIARRMIETINSKANVRTLKGSILHSGWGKKLLDCSVIVCCTDSHGSRAVLNQLAYQYFIPVIDLGVRIDVPNLQLETFGGRVQILSPGLPCLTCQNFLDSSQVRLDLMTEEEIRRDPYVVGAQVPQPAVISLNGTVASLGITMLISYVTGLPLSARHQIYQGERGTVRVVSSAPYPTCVVCSNSGALGRGDAWAMPWRNDESSSTK